MNKEEIGEFLKGFSKFYQRIPTEYEIHKNTEMDKEEIQRLCKALREAHCGMEEEFIEILSEGGQALDSFLETFVETRYMNDDEVRQYLLSKLRE